MTDTRTLSAAAISRQLTRAGFVKSVSTGDGSGTCTRGFIAQQYSPWRAEVVVRPQERPDVQEQTERHAEALRRLGYAAELHRRPYSGGPLVIRVTRPA